MCITFIYLIWLVKFEVLAMTLLKTFVFWYMTLCCLVRVPDVLKGPGASERLRATHPVTVSHSRGCESFKSPLIICRNYFENIMFMYGFV
jgi:hypothetical protein